MHSIVILFSSKIFQIQISVRLYKSLILCIEDKGFVKLTCNGE